MSEPYSLEFKADALVILRHLDGDVEQAAQLLDVAPSLLREWMHDFKLRADEPASVA